MKLSHEEHQMILFIPFYLCLLYHTLHMPFPNLMFLIIFQFGGAELPEATAREIDMLMEQQDQFHLGGEIDR